MSTATKKGKERAEVREDLLPSSDDEEKENEPKGLDVEDRDAYEVFEPGQPWTQVIGTQEQREAWRKGWDLYLEDDDEGLLFDENEEEEGGEGEGEKEEEDLDRRQGSQAEVDISEGPSRQFSQHQDAVLEEYDKQEQGQQPTRPWWEKGKTTPLLNDFDEERRKFYLSQAQGAEGENERQNDGAAQDSVHGRIGFQSVMSRQRHGQGRPYHEETGTIARATKIIKKTWSQTMETRRHQQETNSRKKRPSFAHALGSNSRTLHGGAGSGGSGSGTSPAGRIRGGQAKARGRRS
ncbi:hypothetical protein FA10DRAFT_265730 [Acaromyces ingoldii]|uniref:Uncharacterized protein n=1 Tax=Acaromyces ingoldii TaxID=215250 RepID=A0A316YVW3_9BASI|nr:hypothetical protein FA10DRAFT_265730 [Acaromyces ingoldii]PWN91905.1 hypothetical protein FA10DRAFT_265730 [Acaromyces ingoldii]